MNAAIAHASSRNCIGPFVRLLGAVKWGASGTVPSWVANINDVAVIVEVGLADFGDPDLIIVCRTRLRETFLIFLETKVVSYIDSMQSTASLAPAKWGMEQDGFNSSINGQLTLKYRFAKALAHWDGRSPSISESSEIFARYRTRLNDSERKSPGRTLSKPSIVGGIFGHLGLAGLPEEHCHYVALTWDLEAKSFLHNPDIRQEFFPVFLDESGTECFSNMTHRVGWIGFPALEAALDLANSQEYQRAFRTMLDSPEPPLSLYSKAKPGRWESFRPELRQLSDAAAAAINGGKLDRRDGSFTILDENGVRVAKIIPNQDSVFIGVRELSQLAAHIPRGLAHPDRKRVKDVWFSGLSARSLEEARPIIEVISNYLQHLPPAAEGDAEEVEKDA